MLRPAADAADELTIIATALIQKSGTRKEELLLSKMATTRNSGEFLSSMAQGK